MAGIYSPKNVGKLIFGGAEAAETTARTFRSSASAGETKVLSADGSDVASGVNFKVFSKKADGTVDVSDTIDPNKVTKVAVKAYQAESAKSVAITGFTGNVREDVTYRISIRRYDGIQSPENFDHIHAFYVSPADTSGVSFTDVLTSLENSFNSSLVRMGLNDEFSVVAGASSLIISGKVQDYVLGKDQGDPVQFDIEVSIKPNSPETLAASTINYASDLTITVVEPIVPGSGTAKQVANLEYFLDGYETTDYGREVGWPANFAFNAQTNPAGTYNSVQIAFYSEREYTNVERQHKELNVVFNEAFTAAIAEVSTIKVTVAASADGIATVSLGGVSVNLPLTDSNVATNANEIASTIDALEGYSAVSDGVDTVTITSLVPGTLADLSSFAAGTATDAAATLATVVQGANKSQVVTNTNAFLQQLRDAGVPNVPANLS